MIGRTLLAMAIAALVLVGAAIGSRADGRAHSRPSRDGSTGRTARFAQISPRSGETCVLRADHRIGCWGGIDPGDASRPGRYSQLAADGDCALDLRGAVVCWGESDYAKARLPPGSTRRSRRALATPVR